MNKFVKWTSLMSMVGVILLSSGCSCSVKQDKIDASSEAMQSKRLYIADDNFVDFTSTLKITQISNGVEIIKTVGVKRDIESKIDLYEYNVKSKADGKDALDVSSQSISVYRDEADDKVYIKETNDNINAPTVTKYVDPTAVFIDSSTFVENDVFYTDYFAASESIYEIYTRIPYNACSSASKDPDTGIRKNLPDIAASTVNSVTCEVEKKLFKKDYTYTIAYRVSFDYLVNITIVSDGENRLVSVRREDSIAKPEGKIDKIITEFNVSYDDVNLK